MEQLLRKALVAIVEAALAAAAAELARLVQARKSD
jgi:hypothetical protein